MKMGPFYFLFVLVLGSNFSFQKVEGLQPEKILGGTIARQVAFKYVVGVIYRINETYFEIPCTGSILSEWHIITVAHCFFNKTDGSYINKLFEVVLSTMDLNNPTFLTRYVQVLMVIIPKEYQPSELDSYSTKGDVAIVKLLTHLRLNNRRTTIKALARPRYSSKSFNALHTVSGYGWHELDPPTDEMNSEFSFIPTGRTDRKLRSAEAYILTNDECERIIGFPIAEGNMCAKIVRKNSNTIAGICQFDSGAPLVHSIHTYIDGVAINGGIDCDDEKMPGVYINALYYREFIDNAMNDEITDNMRVLQLQFRDLNHFEFEEV